MFEIEPISWDDKEWRNLCHWTQVDLLSCVSVSLYSYPFSTFLIKLNDSYTCVFWNMTVLIVVSLVVLSLLFRCRKSWLEYNSFLLVAIVSCHFSLNVNIHYPWIFLQSSTGGRSAKSLDCFTSSEVMISSFPKPKRTFAPLGSL